MRRGLVLSAGLLTLLGAITGRWIYFELTTPYYSAKNAEVFVEIARGAQPDAIAKLLEKAGVLRYRYSFLFYLRWTGGTRHLQAGEYRFTAPATPIQIAQRMIRGDVYYVSLTIPEGYTGREIMDLVANVPLADRKQLESAFLRTDWIQDLDPSAQNLEGYLFPDTYRFSRNVSAENIIKTMVRQFRIRLVRLTAVAPLPAGWSASRVVTLASMIEKEVKTENERPLVASVLVNRLNRRIPLACDPTIIYALQLDGNYDGNLRRTDLRLRSPYNTYIYPGLPPGPIANPGESSLRAALTPANSDYLYYVSKNDGTHHFSKDFQSHRIAVARFQKNDRSR